MGEKKNGKVIGKALKIVGRTILIIVVALVALLFCAVKFLESKELSPMAERIANDYIDGHLKVGSLRLGFNPRFPFLGVEVKDLSVISHAFDSLSPSERGLLPQYADSLLTLDYLSGSLDVKRLIVKNELALKNVVLRGFGVNLVIAHDGKSNYEILNLPDDDDSKSKIPGFSINRFSLEQPKEIRFFNAADSTSASVLLLTDAAVESDSEPAYRLKINGNISSRKATLITNLENITFGVNGRVYWKADMPGLVTMEKIEVRGAFIKGVISAEVDFSENPVIRKAEFELSPLPVTDLLTLLTDSLRRQHRLIEPFFSTNASIKGDFELLEPMDLTTDSFPSAKISLTLPPSTLRYGDARFKDIEFDLSVTTRLNAPDSTVINLDQCIIEGPATRFEASAIVRTPFSDPSFDATVYGDLDLANLPPFVKEVIPGYLSGVISTDLHTEGSVSMFSPEHLRGLVAEGNVTANKVYFLSADTSKMVQLGRAKIDFTTDVHPDVGPTMRTKVDIDTVNILSGGVDVAIGSLSLAATNEKSGWMQSKPLSIGGDLNVKRLNIISITDSAGGRIWNVGGNVALDYSVSGGKCLNINAILNTGYASGGTLTDRVLLKDVAVNASLDKPLSKSGKEEAHQKRKKLHREYSYIPPTKVFKYVYEKRHHRKRIRRVYGALNGEDKEVLEWDLANGFSKFLTEWKLKGTVKTHHGRLLTPHFPVHTRISNIDVRFSNDTVGISDISLKLGKSDIVLSGRVSNIRRALTSKKSNTLKANLSLLSDTIEINEIADGILRGAVYADRERHGKASIKGTMDDRVLAARVDSFAKSKPGKAVPMLIPVNIDAKLNIGANHVYYSDLYLNNMGGDLLVYDGGVNLHQLKADSEAGNLLLSALYSAPSVDKMHFGLGMELVDFNIGKFVKLVPVLDSIVPLMHDFSGTVSADIAATCDIDTAMNLNLPTLNAAVRITGDNLAFIDPEKYRTLGKWLGFKNKADNTIHHMNVEMTVADGLMRVYPFAFNIDRYRLGIYGYNDFAMNFDYHLSVLKSPIPFKFGITISGNPKKYKVRFGGAKFNENTAVESVGIVNNARVNLIDEIENVFKRGVKNSRFAKLHVAQPAGYAYDHDLGLSAADSLLLIKEGILDAPLPVDQSGNDVSHDDKDNGRHTHKEGKKNKEAPVEKKKRKRFLFF